MTEAPTNDNTMVKRKADIWQGEVLNKYLAV